MPFVNNYLQHITLAAGATELELALPDGDYVLTIADAAVGAARWEIVHASVTSGTATLQRAQEDTLNQAWPAGSVIYCALTAGTANAFAQIVEQGGVKGDPGPPGKSVELRATATHIQWRQVGSELWMDIVSLAALTPSVEEVADAVLTTIDARLLPAGGTEGQSLIKATARDYETRWADRLAPPEMDRILVSFYDSVASATKWVVFDMGAMEQTAVDISVFGHPSVGTFGRIGYAREPGIIAASPIYGSAAALFNASDLSVINSSSSVSQSSDGMALSPDGQFAAATYQLGVTIWDIGIESYPSAPGTLSGRRGTAFSPDSTMLYVGTGGGVSVVDLTTMTAMPALDVAGALKAIVLSADGEWVAGISGGNLKVINALDNTLVADLGAFTPGAESSAPLTFHPTDKNILIACRRDYDNPASGAAVVYMIDDPGNPITLNPSADAAVSAWGGVGASFNADGSQLYLGCEAGLYIYETAGWTFVAQLGDPAWQNVEPLAL